MLGLFLRGTCLSAMTLVAALALPITGARTQTLDMSKYPDFEGQWRRGQGVGAWDPTKKPGAGQEAPLTREAQAIFEANVKKIDAGKVYDPKWNCGPPGMPRMMMVYQPMEIVIKPKVTYLLLETEGPIRRIYTDGRAWPTKMIPGYNGYSIGEWRDEDGDGRFDTLTIETRALTGTRLFDGSGLALSEDGSTVVKEKIYLDKTDPNKMWNEITTTDSALTRPWTVKRMYQRQRNPEYAEYNCEDNRLIAIGDETYFVGVDGFLMPIAKGQPGPDLRHFQTAKLLGFLAGTSGAADAGRQECCSPAQLRRDRRSADLAHAVEAAERHAHVEFVSDDLDRTRHTGLAGGAETVEIRAAEQA
jgi:hypothetical protein